MPGLSGLSNHNCERRRRDCCSCGLPFFAITVSAIYSLGSTNACNAISASQDLPFDRYSDFTPSRALGAAHKGGGDLSAPNPLGRFTISSVSFWIILRRNINRLHPPRIFRI